MEYTEAQDDRDYRDYLVGGRYEVCKMCGEDYLPDSDDIGLCPACLEKEGEI